MQTGNLLLAAFGQVFHLSRAKYQDVNFSTVLYRSTEIRTDMLVLPSGQTVAAFRQSVKVEFDAQQGQTRYKPVELQNRVSQSQFNKSLPAIVEHQKEAVRCRYAAAHASKDVEFHVAELQACARQGHVQASMDLGMLFNSQGQLSCANYFVEAHNLGHSESLLHLWRTFSRAGEKGAAVRVLLLGASCGSVRCAEALWQILERQLYAFESDEALAALEAGLEDGTVHARYILGYVLLHSDSRRDEGRGRALITESSNMRHYRSDNGKGAPLVTGSNLYAAGTLAHFETLIDQELLAIRTQELRPKFLAEVSKISPSDKKGRAAFDAALMEFNPVPERMVRKIANWLENADDEPVDPVKLERMKALCLPDEDVSKEASDE
jgi:hypothetical protein